VVVVEEAVLVEYVRSTELNVLRHGHVVRATNARQSVLDVVDETFGHERVFVQIHQMRRLQRTHARTHTQVT